MMKAILGSAVGGVVAGVVALVASAQGRAPETAWMPQAQPASPYALTVADTRNLNGAAPTSPAVQCGPQQEAVLQRAFVAGGEVAQVMCVPRIAPVAYASPVAMAPYGGTVYAQPDIVQRPVTRTQSVRPRATRVVAQREVEPQRSWKKTALVIGGSAGAGAGIGALAGGKKGALIGAAIGGGSGAIYEAIKRR